MNKTARLTGLGNGHSTATEKLWSPLGLGRSQRRDKTECVPNDIIRQCSGHSTETNPLVASITQLIAAALQVPPQGSTNQQSVKH